MNRFLSNKTILFLIEDLGSGGAQRQMVYLCEGFINIGYKVTILAYYKREFYSEYLTNLGVTIDYIIEKKPIIRIIKFRKQIRSFHPDAVIAFLRTPSILAEIASLPFKKWQLIVGERSSNPAMLNSFKSKFMRFFHLFADYVVANSYSNIEMVRKVNRYLPEDKSKVIYNIIDTDRFSPDPIFKYRKQGKLRIVVPASYRRLKNILGLINAVSLLSIEEQSKIEIHWYGDKTPGMHKDDILNEAILLINKFKLVKIFYFHEVTYLIEKEIQNADAIGLFSFFEGLPNSVCEGMACGKPIIASNVSDVPLLIEDNITGFLFNPKSIDEIRDALKRLLNSNDETLTNMGRLNRQKALTLFSAEKVFPQYLELINS
ncbi:MAG: glycosyltransferase family 4 protein [Bacteroidales bacterium]|nr:glycosyltransferase family 4 protein [Bacteroidales bacterium]